MSLNDLQRPGRPQGVSSGAVNSTASRRRVEEEANWMDVESSSESYSESEDEKAQVGPRDRLYSTHSTSSSTAAPSHSASTSSSDLTSVAKGHHQVAPYASRNSYADRGRTGGRQQKPLISYVTNEWRTKDRASLEKSHPYYKSYKGYRPPSRSRSRSPNCCNEMCNASNTQNIFSLMWSRLTIRVIVGWIALAFVLWTVRWWFRFEAQKSLHTGALRSAVQVKLTGGQPRGPRGKEKAWFGSQHKGDFQGVRHIGGIRDDTWEWGNGRRMVIIGDVHGCSEPLRRLLETTGFDGARDHLVFTGDLVAKGPDTAAVIDIAREHNASSVRGNHDDKLLLLHRDLTGPLRAMQTQSETPMTGTEVHKKQSELAASLSKENIAYLAQCPLILDLGELPGLAPSAFVVHAGLVPGLGLERQEPNAIMNMRSIDIRTHTPLRAHSPETLKKMKSDPNSEYKDLPPPWDNKKTRAKVFDLDAKYVQPWTRLWEEWQVNVPKKQRELVIYGHDSQVGLVDGPWAVGLDTGCVRGGKLTALILEMKKGKVSRKLQSVQCEDLREKK